MSRNVSSLILAGLCGCWVMTSASGWGASASQARPFDGDRIVRVVVGTRAELEALEATGADILNCIQGVGPMDVLVTPGQLEDIRKLGLDARVIHEDVQALVDAQRTVVRREDPFEDFFLDYHEYGDATTTGTIVWYMNELTALHPTLASMVNVGSTLEDRPIWAVRIANDAVAGNKPAVVYFGCEHAREWIASTVPTYLANHLLENYGTDPTVTDRVDHVEFFLIPVFNVDGFVYSWAPGGRMWRKNRRDNGDGSFGVDNNRNWGEGWGGVGASIYPSYSTYRGPAPFSEPENQVLRDFFLSHPNVRAQIDIHSYSQLILWPWGYKPTLPPDQDVYEDVGLAMQSLVYSVHGLTYTAGPAYTTYYPAAGGSTDWTYAKRDILSFTYELRDTGEHGFLLPPDQIIPNNEEVLSAMLHLANSDWVRSAPLIRFHFPDGLRERIAAGEDATIAVNVIPVLEAVIPGSARLHYRYDPTGPFIELPLTPLGGEEYEVVLPATNCSSAPEFYFSAETDGDSTVTSPDTAPVEVYTTIVSSPGFFKESLDTDPGWMTEGQWAFGRPTGGGGEYGWHDPTSGYTGNNVYGYNLEGDYGRLSTEDYLTSPPIDCTGRFNVHLTFRRWLGVETPPYDRASLYVSNNETDWVELWVNTIQVADTVWTHQDFDISTVADDQPTVYLRWAIGLTSFSYHYCGWNIDDIELYSTACEGVAGDYNGDGDVDLEDCARFGNCFLGPGGGLAPGCGVFDFTSDQNVDWDDWVEFLNARGSPCARSTSRSCRYDGAVPAVSTWGLIISALLILATGKAAFRSSGMESHGGCRS